MTVQQARPFRWFRVKYSPRYVDTSVGHVCMFGDKKESPEVALEAAHGPVSFSTLYAEVCHVAYLMRHLCVPARTWAYLDADDEHAGVVGLLGALRGGAIVVAPGRLEPAPVRDAAIAAHVCTLVLTTRPDTVVAPEGAPGPIVIPLDTLPGLALPKELDWTLPRPLPQQSAVSVPVAGEGGWREITHERLVSVLRDPQARPEPGLPWQDTLARFARGLSVSSRPTGALADLHG